MRLWHQDLIKITETNYWSQHRECCALRGNGWGKKHSTINYIFIFFIPSLFLSFINNGRNEKKRIYCI